MGLLDQVGHLLFVRFGRGACSECDLLSLTLQFALSHFDGSTQFPPCFFPFEAGEALAEVCTMQRKGKDSSNAAAPDKAIRVLGVCLRCHSLHAAIMDHSSLDAAGTLQRIPALHLC